MKKTNIWAYIGLINIILGAVFIILGAAAPGFEHKTFDYWIIVPLAIGFATQVLFFFVNWKLLPLLSAICYAGAFGLTFYHAAPIVMDIINQINFLDGNWTTVIIQSILISLICLIAVIIAFVYEPQKEERI